MQQGCTVCHNFRPKANLRDRTLAHVSFGDRTIVLCEAHRRIAQSSGVTTFDALRELYGESDDGRSYVPRRTTDPHAAHDPERRQADRRSE